MYVNCYCLTCGGLFFFKQKTAYELRISDWSSDVCSSDLHQITQVKRLRKDLCLRNGFSRLQRDGSESSDEHDAHFRRNGGDMLGQLYPIHLRHDDIRQDRKSVV